MLTPKQENFCLAYIETGNASEAYRRSYNAEKMSAKVIANRASELLDNGDIAVRIAELRKPAVEAAQVTLEQHLNDLKRLRDDAWASEKYGPAIQAEISRGKASGLYIDRVESGEPGDFERLNDDELEQRYNANQEALRAAQAAIGSAKNSARAATKAK